MCLVQNDRTDDDQDDHYDHACRQSAQPTDPFAAQVFKPDRQFLVGMLLTAGYQICRTIKDVLGRQGDNKWEHRQPRIHQAVKAGQDDLVEVLG